MVLNYFLEKSVEVLDNLIAESDIIAEKVRFVVPACDMLWHLHPKKEFGPEHGVVWVFPYISVNGRNASAMLSVPLVITCIESPPLATVYH